MAFFNVKTSALLLQLSQKVYNVLCNAIKSLAEYYLGHDHGVSTPGFQHEIKRAVFML